MNSKRICWPHLTMGAILLLMLIRPLDIPWIQDEPLLMRECLALNVRPTVYFGVSLPFSPAIFGLAGTRGIKYGPFAPWIYQILLGITHNLTALVWMRTELVAGCTAVSLVWLARTMRVNLWLAVIIMLSPWMWIYSRQIWDNSFCIPLCALAFAAYADFVVKPRQWTLLLTIFSCWALAMVHLSALALIVPIAAHLLLMRGEQLLKFWWGAIALIFVLAMAADPYAEYLIKNHDKPAWKGYSKVYGWFFPFLGAHHLSATGVGYIMGTHWPYSLGKAWMVALLGARTYTNLAYPIVWLGMALSVRLTWRIFSRAREREVRNHLALLSLAVFLCQCALDGFERVYDLPHYLNGTWIVFVYFALVAIDALSNLRWICGWPGRAALNVYAASMLIVLTGMLWKIARDGGTRSQNYGTVLSDQVEVVRQIAQYDLNSPLDFNQFRPWQFWPMACHDLFLLTNPTPGYGPRQYLVVRYRGEYPDARIMVDAKPLSDQPKASTAPVKPLPEQP